MEVTFELLIGIFFTHMLFLTFHPDVCKQLQKNWNQLLSLFPSAQQKYSQMNIYFSFILSLLTQSTAIYITTCSQESAPVLLLARHLSTPVATSNITPDPCGGHCSCASPVLVGDRYRLTWLVPHNELGDGDCQHLLIIPMEQIWPAMSCCCWDESTKIGLNATSPLRVSCMVPFSEETENNRVGKKQVFFKTEMCITEYYKYYIIQNIN